MRPKRIPLCDESSRKRQISPTCAAGRRIRHHHMTFSRKSCETRDYARQPSQGSLSFRYGNGTEAPLSEITKEQLSSDFVSLCRCMPLVPPVELGTGRLHLRHGLDQVHKSVILFLEVSGEPDNTRHVKCHRLMHEILVRHDRDDGSCSLLLCRVVRRDPQCGT